MFIGRIDVGEETVRREKKEMEWIHRPNADSFGTEYQIFTHKMKYLYFSPPGFDPDIFASDPPFEADARLETFNAETVAKQFDEYLQDYSTLYATDHLFVLFGEDFTYVNAEQNYESLDAMIDYFNAHWSDKYTFQYSTPSDYLNAVNALNHTWPTKYDDMFPYSDNPENYWTGYFSSRANGKAEVRRGSSYLHASSKLYADAAIDLRFTQETDNQTINRILEAKDTMMDAMGIYQHHDAVSGTERQHVAYDYSYRLANATDTNEKMYSDVMLDRVASMSGIMPKQLAWQQCLKTNSTYLDCPIADYDLSQPITVAVHNPSSLDVSVAKMAVPHGKFHVEKFDYQTQEFIPAQADVHCNPDTQPDDKPVDNC